MEDTGKKNGSSGAIFLLCPSCQEAAAGRVLGELQVFARRLIRFSGSRPLRLLLVGPAARDEAAGTARKSGLETVAVETPPGFCRGEAGLRLLADFFAGEDVAYVCCLHTAWSQDFLPALAVRLQAAAITGVLGLQSTAGRLYFQRPLAGGKETAWVGPRTATTIVSLQPGAFPAGPAVETPPPPGKVRLWSAPLPSGRHSWRGFLPARDAAEELATAEIVIAVGNGIGRRENLALAYQLAARLPKAVVAGSRIVCDRGWLPRRLQVGITGTVVAPKLYLACGISGTAQHLAGMSGAEFIVAVNLDATAPIMNVADVGIVADLELFLPALTALLPPG